MLERQPVRRPHGKDAGTAAIFSNEVMNLCAAGEAVCRLNTGGSLGTFYPDAQVSMLFGQHFEEICRRIGGLLRVGGWKT